MGEQQSNGPALDNWIRQQRIREMFEKRAIDDYDRNTSVRMNLGEWDTCSIQDIVHTFLFIFFLQIRN